MAGLTNGFSSSPASHPPSVKDEPASHDNEGYLSDVPDHHAASESSPEPEPADESYNGGSPIDNANEDDSDLENNVKESRHSSVENFSSPEPDRGLKRKSSPMDEKDLIRQNPDLYGLRRSTRARATRLVDPLSDSESDVVAPSKRRRTGPSGTGPSRQTLKRSSLSVSQSPLSESDSDEYGGNRARASKAKRRRLLQSAAPTHAEVRFSTRNAGRVSNYNEEDDDSMFEDDPEAVTQNYWADAPGDDRPAVDIVLNHRLKEGVVPDGLDLDRNAYEF